MEVLVNVILCQKLVMPCKWKLMDLNGHIVITL